MRVDKPWLHFDVHGKVGIRVAANAPTAAQMYAMLGCFATSEEVPDDIVLTATPRPLPEAGWVEHDFRYTPHAVAFPAERVQVERHGDRWRIRGPGELLTSLIPVLDRSLVERGTAMIHAATVAFRGRGVALPAAGGTGKTSVIAKLTSRPDFAFMGDDWAFISADGTLWSFEKPLFIKPHHRPIYPHLFAGAHKPLVPKVLSRPLGKATTLVHPYVIRYPRLADALRRWSPEHRMTPPRRALPKAAFASSAPLALVMFVERYDGARTRLHERDVSWMVDRLIGNFHIELAGFSQSLIAAMSAVGVVPWQDHFRDKARVLGKALGGIPAYLLQVPRAYDAESASDDIVGELMVLLPTSTVPEG